MAGRKRDGTTFSRNELVQVWRKAFPRDVSGRQTDIAGRLMIFEEHGTEKSHSWEVDHIIPVARGGTDNLNNLQPLNWITNREKGDQYPWPS